MSKHLAPKVASRSARFFGRSMPGFHPTPFRSSWAATFFELRQAGFETRLDSKLRVLSNAPLNSLASQKLIRKPSQRLLKLAVLAVAMVSVATMSWNLVSVPSQPITVRAPALQSPVAKSGRECKLNTASVLRSLAVDTVWTKLGGVRFSTVRVTCARGQPRVRVIQRVSDSSVQSFRVLK